MKDASFRAKLLAKRTYCRPLDDGGTETWEQVCVRVCDHQQWLWERALGRKLNDAEQDELDQLYWLMAERKVLPSGRILWMGGTKQAKKTEIAMFNCAFSMTRDVFSCVDSFYLLLNGCGVGFRPDAGLLNGFSKPVKVETVRSQGHHIKGGEVNIEEYGVTSDGETFWRLYIGDSGKAWAKAFGKLLAMKKPVDKVVLDFSEIRKAGVPLKGYGWLSSGDTQIVKAFTLICSILNSKADQLLDEIDILDIINLVGTTLTSRRSAEICMMPSDNANAERFATAKFEHWQHAPWRSQSNNSLIFYHKPSKLELKGLFAQMIESGGSEPGIINGVAAKKRAPWFKGTNPCGEILLPDGGLCNLVDIDMGKFIDDLDGLYRAAFLAGRANYRQTCVNLKDGILSDKWHETNQFLRLCGVSLTGIVKFFDDGRYANKYVLDNLRKRATYGVHSMAEELGLPKSKAVTTVKPSGTLGKIMDTTEGLHRPIGRYVFNNIKFHKSDPLVARLEKANYRVIDDPYGSEDVIVTIPVDNGEGNWSFDDGRFLNGDTAIDQLERYKLLMDNYVDHNASITVSYDKEEVPAIVDWLYENWDSYVGVSFMPKVDPRKTAADYGYPYLPQEVVTELEFCDYIKGLDYVDVDGGAMIETEECSGGACPVR